MSRDVSPPLISSAGAFDLVNVLLDEDGTLYERGGSVYLTEKGLGSTGQTWLWDGYLQPGRRTVCANAADFGVLSSDDKEILNLGGAGLSEPKQASVLSDLLFIGGAAIYGGSRKTAVYSTGTVKVVTGSKIVKGSGTTWSTLVDAGMLFHLSGRVYVVEAINSTTELTLRDPYEGASEEGKTYTLNPVWTIGSQDPYEAWDFNCVCANRLVVASGNVLKCTEVNNPHTFTNSLGTTNEHTVSDGVQTVALATVGQTVLWLTTGGIWTVEGLALDIVDAAGNPQHRISQLSHDVIAVGAAGIASSEQRLVIPAADGIYLMDGISQPQRISRGIERLYRNRIAQKRKLGGAKVYRNHYFLPIISAGGIVTDCYVCRLDAPTRFRGQRNFPWARLSGDAGETSAFAVRSSTGAREPRLLGAQTREPSRVVDCSGFFEPTASNATDADGSSKGLELITRDIPTGSGTINVVRDLVTRYELVALEPGPEQPLLKFYASSGDLIEGGAAWDEVNWDEFNWGADDNSAVFTSLECDAPAETEREIHKCRVNKKFRYARFLIRRTGQASFCGIRELNIRVRPSQAVRR
jgi:hypothetical protein